MAASSTRFPIPVRDDDENHVYLSVGHQQMMTDAMKPLGLSMWQLVAIPVMHAAGGRLFVDGTAPLAAPLTRARLLAGFATADPLTADAMQRVVNRGDFLPPAPVETPAAPALPGRAPSTTEIDPAIVATLRQRTEVSLAALRGDLAATSGPGRIDFVLADISELKRLMVDPESMPVILAAMEATRWLNEQLRDWLGETNAADTLAQSAPGNVTAEMGLALLDVADAIRPFPEVVAFLAGVDDDGFLDEMSDLDGGPLACEAIRAYLDSYGMRCVGEIDITRPRWSERPFTLVPLILGNVRNFEPGAGTRRFQHGEREASRMEQQLLQRLRALPDGEQRAVETKRMIDRVRAFTGYREFPKFGIVRRLAVYKEAIMAEADRLVATGVIREREDIFFLTMHELRDVVAAQRIDHDLIVRRRDEFAAYESLSPPRVVTSDGEVATGSYRRDRVPAGVLVGLAVSTGTVEGRARVILDIGEADLEPGDILVTAFTDPSWTPVFVAIAGLVTEVGGLMTHGAVIAREYGIPAVVGVERATQLIRDGQRIRVDGTTGTIDLLP